MNSPLIRVFEISAQDSAIPSSSAPFPAILFPGNPAHPVFSLLTSALKRENHRDSRITGSPRLSTHDPSPLDSCICQSRETLTPSIVALIRHQKRSCGSTHEKRAALTSGLFPATSHTTVSTTWLLRDPTHTHTTPHNHSHTSHTSHPHTLTHNSSITSHHILE